MKRTNTTIRRSEYRAGFTLVEMLISVTLVLLMMTMFTAIFQMATDSISKQRSIAENDQRARAVTTSIRADIAKRSFQYVLPFYPSEVSDTSPTDFGNRAGYIYISTNDPDSWQDDLLQFTVDINQTAEDPDDTLVFGSAELFYDLGSDPDFDSGGGRTRNTTLRFNVNQPDADDGNLLANGVGASSAAEVCYFVRNGNLYRRVMLLREPLSVAGEDLSLEPRAAGSDNEFIAALPAATGSTNDFGGVFTYVSTPQAINQVDSGDPDHFRLAGGDSVPSSWGVRASNDFWRHFDYSAFPTLQLGASAGVFLPDDLAFNGTDSLDNGLGAVPRLGVPVAVAPSLGDPHHRFGFNFRTGLSREHDNPTELQFIGRFTHAETSHPDFNWPLAATRQGSVTNIPLPSSPSAVAVLNTGTLRGNGNPMDLVGTPLSLDQSTGVLAEFAGTTGRGGPRMVEDLLLANVHGMKVEIWDTRLQRFVQPNNSTLTQVLNSGGGLSTIAGDYHSTRNLNPTFGPRGAAATASNRVFDTWNPQVAGGTTPPPFIPYRYYPPRRNDTPPGPSPNAMADPTTEVDRETGLATNRGYWTPSDFSDADPGNWTYQNYSVGDVVFAAVQFDGDSPDEIFEWDQDIIQPQAFQIAYRCIGAGYAGWSGDYSPTLQQPSWPRVPGQVIQEEQNPLANNTGGPNNPATWIAVDNRQPLESIKVTFQLYDVKTESLRQLSLVLPLTTDR